MDNKRQHIVPRAYLDRFVSPEPGEKREPSLWVFERGTSGRYRRAPKNVAVRSYYDTHVEDGGVRNDAVDELLQEIENAGLPILKRLETGADPSSLSDEERAHVANFVGAMAVRIPGFRDSVEKFHRDVARMTLQIGASHPEYFERTIREAFASDGEEPPADIEAARRFALRGEYTISVDPLASLQAMLQLIPLGANYAYNYRWRVLEATGDDHFVTSDRPLVLVSTERQPAMLGLGAGWESPWMEATLPLGPRSLLLISLHHPEGRETVDQATVREANIRTGAFAQTVYSSQDVPLDQLNRQGDWNWWRPLTTAMVAPRGEDEAV